MISFQQTFNEETGPDPNFAEEVEGRGQEIAPNVMNDWH